MIRNKLRKIEIDDFGNISFFFEGSEEPFVPEEFEVGSPTRHYLRRIQNEINIELPPVQERLFLEKA